MTTIISKDNLNIPTPSGAINATVVLTGGTLYEAGIRGDLAAYVGVGTPEWIAAHGRKCNYHEAQAHFPTLLKEDYRK